MDGAESAPPAALLEAGLRRRDPEEWAQRARRVMEASQAAESDLVDLARHLPLGMLGDLGRHPACRGAALERVVERCTRRHPDALPRLLAGLVGGCQRRSDWGPAADPVVVRHIERIAPAPMMALLPALAELQRAGVVPAARVLDGLGVLAGRIAGIERVVIGVLRALVPDASLSREVLVPWLRHADREVRLAAGVLVARLGPRPEAGQGRTAGR